MANHRLDFPDPALQTPINEFSPTSTPASTNGVVYNWDGVKWVAYIPINTESGASVEVGETPPANPEVGALWWDSSDDSGRLFVWYDDCNTSQWVDASPDSLGHSVNSGENWPSVANENDLFFRTSDGRLYIYYKDDDSSQWIDASPDSPASELWVKSGSDLSPAEDTDNVIIGGGDITLSADGLAEFSNNVTANYYRTPYGMQVNPLSNFGDKVPLIQFNNRVQGNDPVTELYTDGSADFAGNVETNGFFRSKRAVVSNDQSFYNATDATTNQSKFVCTKAGIFVGDSLSSANGNVINESISLNADGKITAVNQLRVDSTETNVGHPLLKLDSGLGVDRFRVFSNGNVDCLGSAVFAGCVSSGEIDTASTTKKGVRLSYGGAIVVQRAASEAERVFMAYKGTDENITLNADGSAQFAGTVTAAGHVFNLEADDDTKYTTTTDEDGNETRVYNGTTLDVKERILNLVTRLDAIEANEMIDDATDTSLLQLLASANARIDSIEQRLAALEGVSN